MLALIIAAAGLWRGLTPDEADAVHTTLQARITTDSLNIDTITASDAQRLLTDAIGAVLEQSRR